MQLPSDRMRNLRENQGLIWHEKRRAVQRKVDSANMLIRGRFLKVRRVKNRALASSVFAGFFSAAVGAPRAA
jgi:hypothetical protein